MATSTGKKPWKIGLLIGTVAVMVWIGYGFAVPYFAKSWEKSNQFGGMFGGIGALFSGLALAGVVAAIWLQKQALEIQREDLRATLAELKSSAEAQTASSRALAKQLEMMQLTVRLNAMNTIVHFHSTSSFFAEPATGSAYEKKIRALLTEIDAVAH